MIAYKIPVNDRSDLTKTPENNNDSYNKANKKRKKREANKQTNKKTPKTNTKKKNPKKTTEHANELHMVQTELLKRSAN